MDWPVGRLKGKNRWLGPRDNPKSYCDISHPPCLKQKLLRSLISAPKSKKRGSMSEDTPTQPDLSQAATYTYIHLHPSESHYMRAGFPEGFAALICGTFEGDASKKMTPHYSSHIPSLLSPCMVSLCHSRIHLSCCCITASDPTPSPQLPKTSVTHTSWCRRVRHSLCLSLQVPSLFNTKSTAADNHQTSLSAQQWNWLLDRCRKRLFTWLWSSFYEPQTNQFDLYLSVRKQTQMEHIAWRRTTTTSTRKKKLLRFLRKQPEILTVYLKV